MRRVPGPLVVVRHAALLALVTMTVVLQACAGVLSNTGEEASVLVDEAMAALPRAAGSAAREVVAGLAGYDQAALSDVIRDAMSEGISGVGDGLDLGDGPLNEEIAAFVERIARSVVRGAVEELTATEIEIEITHQIDSAMQELARSLGETLRPEIEATVRGVARNAAQELLNTVSDPANVEQTNVAIRSFTTTMTAEVQRLLAEDVRSTADGIAQDMGRALRTELVEPTIAQLDREVTAWIDEIDGAVSEGFRQANSVLRVLSSVLGFVLVVVIAALLWVVRARAALAHELRVAHMERDHLEASLVSMARVFAESWAVLERLDSEGPEAAQPGDASLRTFVQAQLNEVRNSTAGVAESTAEGDGSDSVIKAVLRARGREAWIVEYEQFKAGPASFEEWVWRRFRKGTTP